MKTKKRFKTIRLGVILLFSILLVACGRDTSTVESALEGQWTMTDARMNDEPLIDLLEDYEELVDIDTDDLTTTEEGQMELAVDFYYNEGVLTIENSEGELTRIPYEVIGSNEENNSITLEYMILEEGLELTIQEVITFADEDRETMANQLNVVDVVMQSEASEEMTELEQELEQIGGQIVRGILQEVSNALSFDYVADEEAPVAENPN